MSDKKLFLLDAYALIFRAYYAFIKNPRINSKGQNTSAILGFTNTLEEILKKENPTHIAVAFDPPAPTFRKDLYPEYKANRQATPEDIKLSVPYIKQLLKAYNIPVYEVLGFEADDVIGTMAKKAEKEGFTVYMMTPDKDYAQLLSDNIYFYKPNRSGKGAEIWNRDLLQEKMELQNPAQVIDYLALMGDSSDNIPGAPGIGPKTAIKLLTEFETLENLLANTDKLKGKQKERIEENKDLILLSKQLATIALNVPVEINESDLERKEPNTEELTALFEELEFRTASQRILGSASSQNKKESPMQGSLFAQDNTGNEVAQSTRDNIKSIEHNYKLVQTEDEIKALCNLLLKEKSVCFDTETTGLDLFDAELVGISFSIKPHEGWYISVPENREEAQKTVNLLKPFFENENIEKIAQNFKFDYQMLLNYNIDVQGPVFDTMLAHYLIHPDMRHNMNLLASSMLNYDPVEIETLIGKKGKNQKTFRQVPLEEQKEYAVEDSDITLQLKLILEKELKEHKLENVFRDIETPLIKVLAHMEIAGVHINSEALDELAKTMSSELIQLEKEIIELSGGESFNVSSPKQLGEVLFDRMKLDPKAKRTKTKQYSTGEEVLVKLADKHPIINKILEFRSVKKLLSTYVEALPKLRHSKTGRLHTSYNQAVAATGRLSSNNPNLQNIPIREARGKEIRKAFTPANGLNIYLAADYSQIELRLMAHLSQDTHMLEAFNKGEDIHAATAAKIYKKPVNEVTSDERRKAKTANFGIIYGISAFGLAQRLNISRKEAKELIDGYFENFPSVKEYMDKSIQKAREKGYVETIFGRIRNLADINSRNAIVRGIAERNAINAPIQGSAADIIKMAMIRIHQVLNEKQLNARMVLQVHDELVFEVPNKELDTLKEIVVNEMQNAFSLSVPLTVDTGVGQNWLEAH